MSKIGMTIIKLRSPDRQAVQQKFNQNSPKKILNSIIMKSKFILLPLLLGSLYLFFTKITSEETKYLPPPTNGTIILENEEEGENQGRREAWFEVMHRTAPGTDWRAVESETALAKHQEKVRARAATNRSADCEIQNFANNAFSGQWIERGSVNQAGSVLVTTFEKETETIFLVSAGGTLWKGNFEGTEWQVANQDLRFGDQFLELIPTPNGRRLIAVIGGEARYSDDDGATWTAGSGLSANNNSNTRRGTVINVNGDPVVYVLSQAASYSNIKLYQSTDLGESYTMIKDFEEDDWARVDMERIKGSNEVVFLSFHDNENHVFTISDTQPFTLKNTFNDYAFGQERVNITAAMDNGTPKLFTYDQNLRVRVSEDYGATWQERGILPTRPWAVGMYVSEKNPDLLLYGEVECYKSLDGGFNFGKVNNWGAYYNDVQGKLHADIMYFDEVITGTGLDFITISNHGGISISTDDLATTLNIGLAGLNVSQYYDVVTDPRDKKTIYAGSQDQGFQRVTPTNNSDVLAFEQVISGDYGHTCFSENGRRMWTVYPGGWVTFYPDPVNGYTQANWDLESNDETVWIPPMVTGPDPSKNEVYLAGGNAYGGDGSFLIKLSTSGGPNNYTINAEMNPNDFKSPSGGGTISYIAFSEINPDHCYVSTTNGRFFYSEDGGETFEQNVEFLAGSHYLYGAAIHPSAVDENTIYYGGSGYNNPGVYVSKDNGFTFVDMAVGLPSTMVFELDGNEDDSQIFAATEAGPYVFNQDDQKWYDLATDCTPYQTYWSVEYLEETQTARFGTYGRGIWDLAISFPVANKNPLLTQKDINVFPNPTNGLVTLELPDEMQDDAQLQIIALDGKVVESRIIRAGESIRELDLGHLAKGTYQLTISTATTRYGQKVVVQ